MELPPPLTELETLEMLILETKNEITKLKVMDRVNIRVELDLSAGPNSQAAQITALTQKSLRGAKERLKHLEAVRKELIAKEHTDAIVGE